MNHYTFVDGRQPGARYPKLWLVRGEDVWKFSGYSIPGVVQVSATDYEKAGKWSSTRYHLILAPGVRPVETLPELHQEFGDGIETWGQLCEYLGVPLAAARKIAEEGYPRLAQRLDAVDQFVRENPSGEFEIVYVSFGSPRRSESRQGYWDQPKSTTTSTGTVVTIRPGDGSWLTPEIVTPSNARILNVWHVPGYNGGIYEIQVAVS